MRIIDASALSGLLRKTANAVFDFAGVVHKLIMDVRDSYRPELHYMRGPDPKWQTKHGFVAVPSAGHHQPSPVYVRRRSTAHPIR
ncbi:hypothetical protein [Bradyrhizobium elkanii]|uniref:hypothetical protein n=1 Tax=Bradyrhizobium elkanii TaxID=29448 RepID=UPI000A2F00DF|nr:hypothetical protein [Bradyrhizobium elkanii]WLA85140.1 hypothetical protein QNJ99_13450 [Bradyrhizobium elkanii]